ncbi:MAG: universal stress protein [Gammaproteobacteria bacterium]
MAYPTLESVSGILVATDFSARSHVVFEHALALAAVLRSDLAILHVADSEAARQKAWSGFPPVRETLTRWGLLDAAAQREEVYRRLGVRVRKIGMRGSPEAAIGEYLTNHPASLFVAGTAARRGIGRLLRPSVSARVARETRTPTLFLPDSAPGFVRSADGSVHLTRIVVPVDHTPPAAPALATARECAEVFGDGGVTVKCVHVGDRQSAPAVELVEDAACIVELDCVAGDPADAITAAAEPCGLIVMTTAGRCGALEGIVGSTAERVVARAPCPVLTVPSGSSA